MKIHDYSGKIEFLHILQKGPAGASYGVQVAELAGLPKSITEIAKVLLTNLENQKPISDQSFKAQSQASIKQTNQLSLFDKPVIDPKAEALMNELKQLSLQNTSPLQALNQIAKWQESLN
jgi:DNA mismatch repair protein MutS